MKLCLRLRSSRWQISLTLAALATALIATVQLQDSVFGLSLGFAALVSASFHIMTILGLTRDSIRVIHYGKGGFWITLATGRHYKAELVGTRIISAWFVSVNFKTTKGTINCSVPADRLSQTEHRRLRGVLLQHPIAPGRFSKIRDLAEAWWDQYRVG